jgi:hypothetical protein
MDLDLGSAQTPTEVKGILTQDTVWSNQGSPYIFTGAVGVPQGVTLTIQAGATVDLGPYYFEVNGTINVKGSAIENVVLIADEDQTYAPPVDAINTSPNFHSNRNIVLTYGNPQCNIENAKLYSVSLFGRGMYSNAKVSITNSSLIDSSVNIWGSTHITNSYVGGSVSLHGPLTLTNNTFLDGIEFSSYPNDSQLPGSFLVSSNNITSGTGVALMTAGSGTISDNMIWGSKYGITQEDKTTLSAVIERNLIKNNTCGVFFRDNSDDAIIRDNTFTRNSVGISNPQYLVTITGNSFIDNTQYNIQAGSDAVSAKDNWWGTTDRAMIASKIYDSNDDFSLGTIVYQPSLTQANPNSPDPNMCPLQPVITPAPTNVAVINYLTGGQTNASLNNIEIGLTAAVVILSIVIVALVIKAKRSRH